MIALRWTSIYGHQSLVHFAEGDTTRTLCGSRPDVASVEAVITTVSRCRAWFSTRSLAPARRGWSRCATAGASSAWN